VRTIGAMGDAANHATAANPKPPGVRRAGREGFVCLLVVGVLTVIAVLMLGPVTGLVISFWIGALPAWLVWFVRNVDLDPDAMERARQEKPRLPERGLSGAQRLLVASILPTLILLGMLVDEGPGRLVRDWPEICVVYGVFGGIALLFTSGQMTQRKWLTQIRKRAGRRGGAPRCLSILAGSDAGERASWHRRASRAIRWKAARRAVAAPLVGGYMGLVVTSEFHLTGVPKWILLSVVLVVLVSLCLMFAVDALGTPLLLVGRVTRGVTTITTVSGLQPPKTTAIVLTWATKGSVRTAMIEVRAANWLASDGALSSAPAWHDRQEVGMRWRASQRLIEGEHCVLVCATNGLILDRLTDFTRAGTQGHLRQRRLAEFPRRKRRATTPA
jgi:hypothetical protein